MVTRSVGFLLALSVLAGCDARPRTGPTAPIPGTLAVTTIDVVGSSMDDGFLYFVKVGFRAVGTSVSVLGLSIFRTDAGVETQVARTRFNPPRFIGTSVDNVADGAPLDVRTRSAIEKLTVRVEYLDASWQSATAVAETPVQLPTSATESAIDIVRFEVLGSTGPGRFYYWPKLTLVEAGGRSGVTILSINFELLDVGLAGRVPPYERRILLSAGGTVNLDEEGWGSWLEIESLSRATRLSVTVVFVDAAGGRVNSVTKIAPVVPGSPDDDSAP
jgi:hypothetical protein